MGRRVEELGEQAVILAARCEQLEAKSADLGIAAGKTKVPVPVVEANEQLASEMSAIADDRLAQTLGIADKESRHVVSTVRRHAGGVTPGKVDVEFHQVGTDNR